jgi:AraC-like DNA-binding protein
MQVSSFATSDFRRECRIEAWSELIWSAIGRLNTKVHAGADFSGQVQFGDAAGVKLCNAVVMTPHSVARTSELIRRDDRGVLKVVIQLKGRAVIEQCGRQLILSPGEWTLYDASRPYAVVNPEAIEFLAMLVPREKLIRANTTVSHYTLQRFSATAGLGRLVCNYVDALLAEMPALSVDSGRGLVDAAIDLVQLAVTEHFRPGHVLSASVVSRERIEAYINRHLRDPEFSIDMIAEVMHCSKRHLHKTFNEDGETISRFLWNTRLDRCRADLINPELCDKSITLLAFSWGFNNAAHFSRCFRARFGMSPSDFRLSHCAPVMPTSGDQSRRVLALGSRIARTA